jgi:hypothetical protein
MLTSEVARQSMGAPGSVHQATAYMYVHRVRCGIIHSVAPAVFMLWRRSPQAAQFLRIAVHMNPSVLAKIMARRHEQFLFIFFALQSY